MPDSAWGYSLPRIFTEREAKQSRCAEALRRLAAMKAALRDIQIVAEDGLYDHEPEQALDYVARRAREALDA